MSIMKKLGITKPKEILEGSFVNKPVISIPDNWSDLIIGLCINQHLEHGAMTYVVRDFVSGEEKTHHYKTYIFTEQRMQFALKSDRFDLCSFIYEKQFAEETFDKKKEIYLLKIPEVIVRLRTNGFWEILLEYKEKND